jgi:hypothetical protein
MTDTTVDEAAAAVVASRRALTAAERRVRHVQEGRPTAPEADRAEPDRQLAQETHRLAVERLKAALRAATPGGVDHEHAEDDLRSAIRASTARHAKNGGSRSDCRQVIQRHVPMPRVGPGS